MSVNVKSIIHKMSGATLIGMLTIMLVADPVRASTPQETRFAAEIQAVLLVAIDDIARLQALCGKPCNDYVLQYRAELAVQIAVLELSAPFLVKENP